MRNHRFTSLTGMGDAGVTKRSEMLRESRFLSIAARRLLPVVFGFILTIGGCVGQTQSRSERGRRDASTGDSVMSGGRREDSMFVDRRAEINPTPLEVTQRHMSIVARALEKAYQGNGKYPTEVREILSLPISDPNISPQEWWLIDGWNRPFRYVPRVDGYELRSAGADGIFESADDLVQEKRA
jgi:hypothetical protein